MRKKHQIICGVYEIRNLINNKVYIGSSKDIYKRWGAHRSDLKLGKHMEHFQNAWNYYGEDSFKFSIIEECNPEERYDLEQEYIDMTLCYKSEFGYNSSKKAKRYINTIESEKKMGDAHKELSAGERNPQHKYTENQIKDVINLLLIPEYTYSKIAKITGVSMNVVNQVANHVTWNYLTTGIVFPIRGCNNRKRILSVSDVNIIIKRLLNGERDDDIATDYGVKHTTIYDIRTHQSWKKYTEGIVFPLFTVKDKDINYYKLTPDDIISMIDMYNNGASIAEIERTYRITHKIIVEILKGIRWKEYNCLVVRPLDYNIVAGENHPKAKLSEKDVIDILRQHKEGISFNDICNQYNCVKKSAIRKILNNVSWKCIDRNTI